MNREVVLGLLFLFVFLAVGGTLSVAVIYGAVKIISGVNAATRRRIKSSRESAAARRLAQDSLAHGEWEARLRALALTCSRCDGLALPIPTTRDRYVCPSCRNQFAGAPHDVPQAPRPQ